jgi:signal peptidase II
VRVLLLLFGLAVAVFALDQAVKAAVVAGLEPGVAVPVIGELLQLRYVTNSGAAFSALSGFTWVLSLIALGVIVFIVWFARRIRSAAWAVVFGVVLGGALGNVTDRFVRPPAPGRGHVVDYIQVWGFPAIFNIADIAVCVAMGLFVILTIRGVRLDGSRHVAEKAEAEPADSTTAPADTESADTDARSASE